MRLISRLKSSLFYSRYTKKKYEKLEYTFQRINRRILSVFSCLSSFIFITLFLTSLFLKLMYTNRIIYGITSFLSVFIFIASEKFCKTNKKLTTLFINIFITILYTISINIGLGVFNLIPLPPLDGSKVLMHFLPAKGKEWFYNNQQN